MKRYHYGNYGEYVECQRAGWSKKRDKVWVLRENIEILAKLIAPRNPEFGICHGARTGSEQKWFMECLGCKVIGTDIGDGENTVQWDFNERNPEWVGLADFVYSNSFDHAFDLGETLKIWYEQLKPSGVLILEHSTQHQHDGSVGNKKENRTDPIGVTVDELLAMVPEWTGCKKIEALELPATTKSSGARHAVMIE
jgi:hypothetical protein